MLMYSSKVFTPFEVFCTLLHYNHKLFCIAFYLADQQKVVDNCGLKEKKATKVLFKKKKEKSEKVKMVLF